MCYERSILDMPREEHDAFCSLLKITSHFHRIGKCVTVDAERFFLTCFIFGSRKVISDATPFRRS